jgi:hypothetical protein
VLQVPFYAVDAIYASKRAFVASYVWDASSGPEFGVWVPGDLFMKEEGGIRIPGWSMALRLTQYLADLAVDVV